MPLKGRPRAASIQSWKPQANGCWIVRNEASNPCPCCTLRLSSRRHGQDRCRAAFAGPQSVASTSRRRSAEEKPVLPGEQPCRGSKRYRCRQGKVQGAAHRDPLDYEILPPIKEGICGTPAPVLLRAVGTDPKVTINPPATLSCPMADVLGEWLRDTVQPEAKKLFGSTVVKIQNASSYVCRNRYGGETTPLSEHALANALDVAEFVLATASTSPFWTTGQKSLRFLLRPRPIRSARPRTRKASRRRSRHVTARRSRPPTSPPSPRRRLSQLRRPHRRRSPKSRRWTGRLSS